MATCPSNAVLSSQDVATGNLTCYDINGNIIGTPITGNSPIPVGPGKQCIIRSTTKIVTNLATNFYQCKNDNGTIFSNSNPCPAQWGLDYQDLSLNGTLKYGCSDPTGTKSLIFSCPYNITPTKNNLTGLITGCIIPGRPPTSTPISTPTSTPTSTPISTPTSQSPSISSSSNTSSSNLISSSFSPSSTSSSSTESTNNTGLYTVIIGILITILIGVISYFVFFKGSSTINKSIGIINKGGYYYFK
jgi:hypothetical protein